MIKLKNLDFGLRSMVRGMMLGDVFFLNGDLGDDNANGKDFGHAMRTLGQGVGKLIPGNHDYLLCCGAETLTTEVAISQADCHIIGIGNGGMDNVYARGFQATCAATVDTLQLAATADGVELAGFCFIQNATSHILIDDAGADNVLFHHNTTHGGAAITAILLDIEGAQWTINDNLFLVSKLAIDTVGADTVIQRNTFQSVDAAAKAINLSNATADRVIVQDNIFNLSGGTGDVGVTVITGANQCSVVNNLFHATCSDAINDSGTGTLIIGNQSAAITGTSGASLGLAIED